MRKFTKYPSESITASKSWGKISTNPKIASLIIELRRFLEKQPEVTSADCLDNGDIQFIVDETVYYLKVYKR